MAQKRKINYDNPPENLDDHIFYGLQLNDEQCVLRDMVYDKKKNIVFCNSGAGTGKTTIALATAIMMVKYNMYSGIVYVVSPYGEGKQGYLPGDITQKSSVYFEPVYDAIYACNEDPNMLLNNDNIDAQKYGESMITCITHTYLRGCNLKNKIVILDETQNFTESDLRKTITRVCNDSKTVVIGHTGQIDLPNKNNSGFQKCINHFLSKNDNRVGYCELSENYRGWVSQTADEEWK